jgi:peptidoglycan-associated lipoprotein
MSTHQVAVAMLASCALTAVSGCSKKQKSLAIFPADQRAVRNAHPASSRTVGMTSVDDAGRRIDLAPVYFAHDSSEISAEYRDALAKVARWLSQSPGIQLTIEGHCDERGTDEYNIALGERRALALRDYLQRLGVAETRMSIISYGEERPAVDGSGEAAWLKNRRGELRER